MEGGLGALRVVSHAANRVVALSVLRCRGFSWGLWVLGGGPWRLRTNAAQPPLTPSPSPRRPVAAAMASV